METLTATDYNRRTLEEQLSLNTEMAKRAYGDLLSGLTEWQWFVTMTFRKRVGLWAAERLWSRFWTEQQRVLGRLEWWRATEYQSWRGVPHYHALVTGIPSVFNTVPARMLAKEMANDIAGFTRILPYDPEMGAAEYLAKYTVKELGDIKFTRGLTISREKCSIGIEV